MYPHGNWALASPLIFKMHKIIRTSTVPLSLGIFCQGQLAALSDDYEVIALSSPGVELNKINREENIRTIEVFMSREISPFTDLRSLIRLIGVFLREHPKMVHSMTPKAGLLSMLAARIARVPVRLHSFTGLLFPTASGAKKMLFATCDKLICRCATNIIAEGQGVRKDLIRHKITKKEIRVLGFGNVRGIDLDFYKADNKVLERASVIRQELGARPATFVFLFVGRIVADKGIDNLVEAFLNLTTINSGLRLLLVGEYEDRDPIRPDTRRRIESSPMIIKTGWVEDTRPYYAASDLLVFPSRREGFPNVVIEAGAMGLPSIVTDINGSNEIIADGVNGRIIPGGDLQALTDEMKNLSENTRATAIMAKEARKIVSERYEQSFVWAKLKNYYKEILK